MNITLTDDEPKGKHMEVTALLVGAQLISSTLYTTHAPLSLHLR